MKDRSQKSGDRSQETGANRQKTESDSSSVCILNSGSWILYPSLALLLALSSCGPTPDERIRRGIELYGLGRYALAEGQFERALWADADNPDVYAWLGYIAVFHGEFAKALEYAARIEALKPEHAAGPFLRGAVFVGQEENDKALPLLREAVKRQPWFARHAMLLGEVEFALGHAAEAEAAFAEAVRREPRHTPARLRLAAVQIARGEYQPAADTFREVLGDEPDCLDALLPLAALYVDRREEFPLTAERLADIDKRFRRFIDIDGSLEWKTTGRQRPAGRAADHPATYYVYGLLLRQANDLLGTPGALEKSHACLRRAVIEASYRPEYRLELARSAERLMERAAGAERPRLAREVETHKSWAVKLWLQKARESENSSPGASAETCRRVLAIEPDNEEARQILDRMK
jgi:tetratricopeptide (TPR) repeat protein